MLICLPSPDTWPLQVAIASVLIISIHNLCFVLPVLALPMILLFGLDTEKQPSDLAVHVLLCVCPTLDGVRCKADTAGCGRGGVAC